MSYPVQPSSRQGSVSLHNSTLVFLPSFKAFVPLHLQSPLIGFHGVGDEKLPQVFLEFVKEIGAKVCFRKFQKISTHRCKGHRGESFARDFQFERCPCWEGLVQN